MHFDAITRSYLSSLKDNSQFSHHSKNLFDRNRMIWGMLY